MCTGTFRSTVLWCAHLYIAGLSAQSGTWTWMHGSDFPDAPGSFGVQGVPSITNTPPALYQAVEWTDLSGNFWIWSGLDPDFNTQQALWRYEPATGLWTWMKGPSTSNYGFVPGEYGIQGVPAPTNYPAARSFGASSWVGADGALWLFGGSVIDPNTFQMQYFNDLWRYDIATNMWTWVKGPVATNTPGVYGAQQVEAASNLPPARREGVSTWTSDEGDLWMFGGENGNEFNSELADMWKYKVATNNWVWMSGATGDIPPNHGTIGIPSVNNTPGSRAAYAHWKDDCGDFWLFGGWSQNDMWKYETSTNQWTWMAGPQDEEPATLLVSCDWTSQFPAKRIESRTIWKDGSGRFWAYGGQENNFQQAANMWAFDPDQVKFMGVRGNEPENFGTLGVPNASNSPIPDLEGGSPFIGNDGSLWFFGGLDLSNGLVQYNSLWRYQIDPDCPGVDTTSTNGYLVLGDRSGCAPFTFSPSVQGTSVDQLLSWNFGDLNSALDTSTSTTPIFTYDSSGAYTVTLDIGAGPDCLQAQRILFEVVISTAPTAAFTATPQPTTMDNTSIQFTDDSSPNIVSWHWDFDSIPPITSTTQNPQVTYPSQPGTYPVMLVVENAQGCTDTLRSVVVILPSGELELPNVFSPNADGENDRFVPLKDFAGAATLHVFDRWGKEIFRTTNISFGWDGHISGAFASEGTYYWTLQVTDENVTATKRSGYLTLLR